MGLPLAYQMTTVLVFCLVLLAMMSRGGPDDG